jgi:hypothetical protein
MRTVEELVTRHSVSEEVEALTRQWHTAYTGGERTREYLETLGSEIASHGDHMLTSWAALVLELDIEAGGTDMWRAAVNPRGPLPYITPTNAVIAATHFYDLSEPDSAATQTAARVLAAIEGSHDRPRLDDHFYLLAQYDVSPHLVIRMMRMVPEETFAWMINAGMSQKMGYGPRVRYAAAEAAVTLAHMEARQLFNLTSEFDATEEAGEALDQLIDAPHWVMRLYGLHAMGGNPGLWDLQRFERLLNDENEDVAREARWLVRRLNRSGRDDRLPHLPEPPAEPDAAAEPPLPPRGHPGR